MKNKFLLLVVLLFSWISASVAAVVPSDVAAEMARELLTLRGGEEFKGGQAYVETVSRNDNPVYYIVRFEHGGWAMISAEDTTEPLLGYSFESEMPSPDQQPDVMKDWFNGYINQIEHARTIPSLQRHYRWTGKAVTRAAATDDEYIAPIITINWDQGAPYNAKCPMISGTRAVVGCVAVGIGQALSVVRYPLHGTGTKSYTDPTTGVHTVNFDEEADYNWDAIMSGANNSSEVARLLYHCGVLVEMQYGTGASGAAVGTATVNMLKTHYGYPNHCKYLDRSSYKDNVWKELMLEELRRGRAIVYAGQNTSGHCFNLDGYDGSMFHVNWGWSGTSNGFYSIDDLTPTNQGIGGSDSGYNTLQRAIVGVAPLTDTPYELRLSTTQVGLNSPAGTWVANVLVYSDKEDAEYDYELHGPEDQFFGGYLSASYEVRDNKLYTNKVIDGYYQDQFVTIKATNKISGESIERTFAMQCVTSGIDEVLAASTKLYPVPATDVLNIEVPEVGEYTIFNVAGVTLLRGELTEMLSTIDVSTLSSGSYMLRYTTAKGMAVKSFIVK